MTLAEGGQPEAVLFVADPATGASARTAVQSALSDLGLPADRVREVDVFREPRKAMESGALATPALRVEGPQGPTWVVGDFSSGHDLRRVLACLVDR